MTEGIILSIIFFLIGSWLIFDTIKKFRVRQQTPIQQQPPVQSRQTLLATWKTKIFVAKGSIIKGTIVLIIALVVLWPTFGPADKTYGSEEFSKVGCTAAVLSSTGCTLSGTEKMSIVRVEVITESLPTGGEILIGIGSYQFKYSSYYTKKSGYSGAFYKGEVYQQGFGPITYVPEEPGKPTNKPFPIVVLTNRWSSIPLLAFPINLFSVKGDPELQIGAGLGGQFLAYGALRDEDPPVQGLVTVKSTGTAGIKEVQIYYGSLWRTIAGLAGMS